MGRKWSPETSVAGVELKALFFGIGLHLQTEQKQPDCVS